MNLILIDKTDYIDTDQVRLTGRRLDHIRTVHRASPGDSLMVGELNGLMGTGRVTCMEPQAVELRLDLDMEPPQPLPLILVMALPRPKMLRRILQTTASLGVKDLYLMNTWRVEKAYWSSPILAPETMDHALRLGLEQARDTCMPRVRLRRFFTPFVRDELADLAEDRICLTAHPGPYPACPSGIEKPAILVLGPEGGLIYREVDSLSEIGFQAVSLGERILRLETAVPFVVSRLFSGF